MLSFFFFFFFFFFQAEDGIRDVAVTGVQTCALPISAAVCGDPKAFGSPQTAAGMWHHLPQLPSWCRSEERRVGKSVDLGGRRIIKKKKKKNKRQTNKKIKVRKITH